MKDGLANVKTNFNIMDYVSKLLSESDHIVFFAEGGCIQEKRLRPIQKGVARQAFQTIEKYGELDIHICPASVNYGLKTQVRDVVKFDFGQPIRVLDYLETYRENPNKAIKELTEEIQKRIRVLVVHIEKDEDRPVVEQIQELIENQINAPLLPIKSKDKIPLRYDRLVANSVNDMPENKKNDLKISAFKYFDQLKNLGVTDYGILHRDFNNIWTKINLALGFLPFLIGKIILYPCWIYGKSTADTKVGMGENVEFYSSVRFGVSTFLFLLFYTTLIISALIINNWSYYLFVTLVPFLCYFNLAYREYHQKWKEARKGSFIQPKEYQMLMEMRSGLVKGFA
jgi:hypothetical protein